MSIDVNNSKSLVSTPNQPLIQSVHSGHEYDSFVTSNRASLGQVLGLGFLRAIEGVFIYNFSPGGIQSSVYKDMALPEDLRLFSSFGDATKKGDFSRKTGRGKERRPKPTSLL
ncbi:hypothetical protein VNO77_23368 [Canavalia gladiata]|uniref:Uncharacterized protein n=1 Tax=Canavalia gladiata TaxID=3824 RepID=A0AAN9L4D4_CANGL